MSSLSVTSAGTDRSRHPCESREFLGSTDRRGQERIMQLNRERPRLGRFAAVRVAPGSTVQTESTGAMTLSTMDGATVLGGIQGALATLAGCAALDTACAR
jgi:hypothetical protein